MRFFVIIALLLVHGKLGAEGSAWMQWRGPLMTGESPGGNPPVEWGESKNIKWRVKSPGLGHGSPVLADDQVFLLTADPVGEASKPKFSGAPGAHDNSPVAHDYEFAVVALGVADGQTRWRTVVARVRPKEGGHVSGTLASYSAVTDGKRVYAFFGSRGLYALDLAGALLWKRSFGEMQSKHGHGEGSTPVLHGNTIAINWDHEGASFVAAFDTTTGKEMWRVPRDEKTSWASPIVVTHQGVQQLVVSGTKRIRAYGLDSGKLIWACGGLSHNVVASPVAGAGMVFAGSSYEKQAMLGIRLEGAKGDITGTNQVVWMRRRRTPYVPSPLLYRGNLYVLNHYQNVLSTIDAKTGEDAAAVRRLVGIGNQYASPVGAAGRIYFSDRHGATIVLDAADDHAVLAVNRLEDSFSASAAIVGRSMYLRGERYVYRLEND